MRRTLVIVGILIAINPTHAQNFEGDSIYYTPIPKGIETRSTENKDNLSGKFIGYFFNVQVGPLVGCSNCGQRKEITFTSSTVHGLMIGRKLRAGAGIGFDAYYLWQTLPVFGSAELDN